jgi:hypothetical protein
LEEGIHCLVLQEDQVQELQADQVQELQAVSMSSSMRARSLLTKSSMLDTATKQKALPSPT